MQVFLGKALQQKMKLNSMPVGPVMITEDTCLRQSQFLLNLNSECDQTILLHKEKKKHINKSQFALTEGSAPSA